MRRFRAIYGASPMHLLALLASLAITAAAATRVLDSGSDALDVALWFAAAIVAHDLVLLPLYSLLDRIAGYRRRGGSDRSGQIYLRVPAILSGLMALVFSPLILGLSSRTYHAASTLRPTVYLTRWLIASAVLFAGSAVAYAIALRRGGGGGGT